MYLTCHTEYNSNYKMGDIDSDLSSEMPSWTAAQILKEELTPLMWAAVIGDLKHATLLMKSGASPTEIGYPYTGDTPLDEAIKRGHTAIVREMLKHCDDRLPRIESMWNGGKIIDLPELLLDLYQDQPEDMLSKWREIKSLIETHIKDVQHPKERGGFMSRVARMFANLLRKLRLA